LWCTGDGARIPATSAAGRNTSLEQAGFLGPATAEEQKRDEVVESAVQTSLQRLLLPETGVTEELQGLGRAFDLAMEKHAPTALAVISLPRWRFRFPPYHYGVTDNGSAQVKQASVDGRLFVNALSGNITSGLPGRITGVATVGMEVTAESLDATPKSRPVGINAYLDWGASWNIAVSGYAPLFVPEPWGEVRMRLNLLVFGPEGYLGGSGPRELVTAHFNDGPGSRIREWSGQPAGDLSIYTEQNVFFPIGVKRWVNVDLYVEANSGATEVSWANAFCMASATLSKLRFWLL
jgi:hypothetical protein